MGPCRVAPAGVGGVTGAPYPRNPRPPAPRRRARRGHAPPPTHRPGANREQAPARSRCAHPPPSSRLRSSRGDPHRPAGRLPTTGGGSSGTIAHNETGGGDCPQHDQRGVSVRRPGPTGCRRLPCWPCGPG
ncbi:hypothetical protein EIZ62_09720 [Streptomyces ficellus]|uniref:Uncharacterized protein n=1 Tax=Streptomyces ficellus TaxID=1977088 RepID=A0A6I6F3B5_9ACTN|nr:hypothetical protein EIZ62_09720 [Streptomyces ficellus]